ncbi:MAG TPA: hypothetical protein VFV81_01750, partial [Verrucomicrobiae bacterium]|nr:hypothetical protein [Verrucomicrobiae bacterium]
IRGEWKYEERGILDKTHLRFYTRNGIENLFRDAGFEVRTLQGINPWHNMTPEDSNLWWRYRCFGWLPIRGIHDMRYLQFAVVARRQSGTNAG